VTPSNNNTKCITDIQEEFSPKENLKDGEAVNLKNTHMDTDLDDKFQRNVEYYFLNNISTLIDSKKLLMDRPIGGEGSQIIKKFVESFGKPESDLYDYPDNIGLLNYNLRVYFLAFY
jgi:hypothetical protein